MSESLNKKIIHQEDNLPPIEPDSAIEPQYRETVRPPTPTPPEQERAKPEIVDINSILVTRLSTPSDVTRIEIPTPDDPSSETTEFIPVKKQGKRTQDICDDSIISQNSVRPTARQCNVIRIPSPFEIENFEDDSDMVKRKKKHARRKLASKSSSSAPHKHQVSAEDKSYARSQRSAKKTTKSKKKSAKKKSTKGITDDLLKDITDDVQRVGLDTPTTTMSQSEIPKSRDAFQDLPDLPDLPVYDETKLRAPSAKSSRHLIPVSPRARNHMTDNERDEQEQTTGGFYDFGDLDDDSTRAINKLLSVSVSYVKPWMSTRVALSRDACRFELPIDMTSLESMSAQEYLRRHVAVSPKREYLYKKMFYKHKNGNGRIPFQDLGKSLRDVLVSIVSDQTLDRVISLLAINTDTPIDFRLYSGIAAFMERLLYAECLTDETKDMVESQRHAVECADFCSLQWRCHGVKVNPSIKEILDCLS